MLVLGRPHEQPIELDLLLHCARTCLDSQRIQRVTSLLQDSLDWATVTQMAFRHGVMPLLYRSLQTTSPSLIPPATFGQLQNAFRQNMVRNAFMARELVTLLDLFTAHGIMAIPFKGPTLAVLAYGHLSLRQFGDLDFFVPKRDIPRAATILFSHGYQARDQSNHECPSDPLAEKYHTFIRKDGLVGVDLQWMIADNHFSFQLDHEDWQTGLGPVSLSGSSVMSFPPEVMLLILCVHGSKHQWTRLQWVCDVAELLRAFPELDWERVTRYASRYGSQRMLALGVLYAHDLLGTTLPTEVLGRFAQDEEAASLVRDLRPQLDSDGEGVHDSVDPSVFYLWMRGCWWDKVKYAIYLCIKRKAVAKEQSSCPPPVSLTFLYYLLWLFLKVGKYGLRSQRIKKRLSEWLERMG